MAVMMSKCPECGAAIGGRFHRHLDTNHRIGAVTASYNPLGYGMQSEDQIHFDEIANVVHKSRRTAFARQDKGLNSICEEEAVHYDKLKKRFEQMEEAPEYLVCPLSFEVFIEPVVTPNGNIYEKKFIEEWLEDHDSDPLDFTVKLNKNELKIEKDVHEAARLWRSRNETEVNGDDDDDDDINWDLSVVTN